MGNGVIYKYVNKKNGKSYIGQTMNEKQRIKGHRRPNDNTVFHKAVRKYGYEGFDYIVLHSGIETREELNELEIRAISEHNTMVPNGYNLETGGPKCRMVGFISKSAGRKRKGRVMSDETRRRMSVAHKGVRKPEGFGARLSIALTGRVFTPDHCKNISEGKKGVVFSQEYKDNMSKITKTKKPVLCVTTGIVYDSVKHACRENDLFPSNLTSCVKGRQKSCGGMEWRYVNES